MCRGCCSACLLERMRHVKFWQHEHASAFERNVRQSTSPAAISHQPSATSLWHLPCSIYCRNGEFRRISGALRFRGPGIMIRRNDGFPARTLVTCWGYAYRPYTANTMWGCPDVFVVAATPVNRMGRLTNRGAWWTATPSAPSAGRLLVYEGHDASFTHEAHEAHEAREHANRRAKDRAPRAKMVELL